MIILNTAVTHSTIYWFTSLLCLTLWQVEKVKPNTEVPLPSLTTENYTKCLAFYQAEFSPLHPIHVTVSCNNDFRYMKHTLYQESWQVQDLGQKWKKPFVSLSAVFSPQINDCIINTQPQEQRECCSSYSCVSGWITKVSLLAPLFQTEEGRASSTRSWYCGSLHPSSWLLYSS